nr:zinc finger protein 511-like isoform X1 [Dermacentor andersoni]
MDWTTVEPLRLSSGQMRILLTEGVDLSARSARHKVTVLDADCDPGALERRHRGTLRCACPREFDSVREFESHYASRHHLTCTQCRIALPTEYLLELHIAESHSPIFAARPTSTNHPKYECVVEGCTERFASWADRKQHTVDAHRYPAGFAYFPHAPVADKHQARPIQHRDVPRRICFGRGSQVAWHQQRPPSTSRTPRDLDMRDMAEALDT